jgi:hypothetical protein
LAQVRSDVALLHDDEEAFVKKVAGRASPTPTNHERIMEFNRSGRTLEENPIELEAGANRCAAG